MSIVDPEEVRRLRSGRRRPVVRAVVTFLLLTACAIAGYSWGALSVVGFETPDAGLEVAAIVCSVLAWASFLLFSIATLGSWRAGSLVLGGALAVFGVGLIAPRAQGAVAVLEFPGWLGLSFVALGVLVWVGTVVARAKGRQRRTREERTVSHGVETRGTVTRVPRGPNPTSRGLWAPVTFTFTDAAGVQRWVERPLLIHREGDVKVGDTTRLWYDADDPGDEAAIVVQLARENPMRMPV